MIVHLREAPLDWDFAQFQSDFDKIGTPRACSVKICFPQSCGRKRQNVHTRFLPQLCGK